MKYKNVIKHNPAFILAFLFSLYILYGVLIPFDITIHEITSKLKDFSLHYFFQQLGAKPRSTMDVITNIGLYTVFGFLLYAGLRVYIPNFALLLGVVTFIGFLLSFLSEFIQFFSSSRISSTNDIIHNTIGGLLGGSFGAIYFLIFHSHIKSIFKKALFTTPILLLLIIYLLLSFLYFTYPYDFSLQISDIKEGVKKINLIPFRLTTSLESYISGFTNTTLIYIIFGFLAGAVFRKILKEKWFFSITLTLIFAVIYATGIESTQIFVRYRYPDVTDIIIALGGAYIGYLLSRWYRNFSVVRKLYYLIILINLWSPFTFRWKITFSLKSLIPFYSYIQHMNIFTIQDIIGSIIIFIPLGYLWVTEKKKTRFFSAILSGISYALLPELGQLFILHRYFDITGVILGSFGFYIGTYIYMYVEEVIDKTLNLNFQIESEISN